jgi:uncharacterized iron-regulated protein
VGRRGFPRRPLDVRDRMPDAALSLGSMPDSDGPDPYKTGVSEMKFTGIRCLPYVALLLTCLSAGACGAVRTSVPASAQVEGISGLFRTGQIVCPGTGEIISFDELIRRMETIDLIFVGEVHDNPEHHLIQVQILQAIMSRYGPVPVAMEFFQEPQQAMVDRYVGGAVEEAVFLKEVDWKRNWSFDYHFYRPLLLLAKERKARILAINAPHRIVKKVAGVGLQGLEPVERGQLARRIDLGNARHRAFLRNMYEGHPHGRLKNFEFFYQAQCVWEDTMAENLADHYRKGHKKMVVLTGNGHIIHRYGVPDRTLERVPAKAATLVLYPLTGPLKIKRDIADYIWLTGHYRQRRPMFHDRHGSKGF